MRDKMNWLKERGATGYRAVKKQHPVVQLFASALIFAAIGGYLTYHSFAYTPPAPTASIDSNDSVIYGYGDTPVLNYSSTNATSCKINGVPVKAANGDNFYKTKALTKDTTFTLSCNGSGGTASDETTVYVDPPASVNTDAASTNAASTYTPPTSKVNFILFCASDTKPCNPHNVNPRIVDGHYVHGNDLFKAGAAILNWYRARVGKSFSYGDMNFKVARGDHSETWYRGTDKPPAEKDYAKKYHDSVHTVRSVGHFLARNGYVPNGNIDVVLLAFHMYGNCGVAGGNNIVTQVSPQNYRNVSVTDPFNCTGPAVISDMAHELGHSFGLPHDNIPGGYLGASCSSYSSLRNYTLMDCEYACNGKALPDCKLNGHAYGSHTPDWKVLASQSPFFH